MHFIIASVIVGSISSSVLAYAVPRTLGAPLSDCEVSCLRPAVEDTGCDTTDRQCVCSALAKIYKSTCPCLEGNCQTSDPVDALHRLCDSVIAERHAVHKAVKRQQVGQDGQDGEDGEDAPGEDDQLPNDETQAGESENENHALDTVKDSIMNGLWPF